MNIKGLNIFIFDLDGTLTKSKSPLDSEMAQALCTLLRRGKKVVVTSGASFSQMKDQFLSFIKCEEQFMNLYLLPTSGAVMYSWDTNTHQWKKEYEEALSDEEEKKITSAIQSVMEQFSSLIPKHTHGLRVEDRKTQITFSAYGQDAPYFEKKKWDADHSKRKKMVGELEKLLPGYEILIGGGSSIDITRLGIDKAYGVEKFFETTRLKKEEAVFFGDKIIPGGNDYSVVKTGIRIEAVLDPSDTLTKLMHYVS